MSREHLQSFNHHADLSPLTTTQFNEGEEVEANRLLRDPGYSNENLTPPQLQDSNNNTAILRANASKNLVNNQRTTQKKNETLSNLIKNINKSSQSMLERRDQSSDVEHSISREIDSNLAHIDIDTFNFRQIPEPLSRLISLIDINDDRRHIGLPIEEEALTKPIVTRSSLQSINSKNRSEEQKKCLHENPINVNLPHDITPDQVKCLNANVGIQETFGSIFGTVGNDTVTNDENFQSLNSEVKYTIAFRDSISSGASSDLSQTLNDSPTVSQCESVNINSISKEELITVRSQHTDSAINSSITQEEKPDSQKNSYNLLKNNNTCKNGKSSLTKDSKGDNTSHELQSQAGHQSHLLCQEIINNGNLNYVIDRELERESGQSNTRTNDIYVLYPNYSLPDLNFLKSLHKAEVGQLITEKKVISEKTRPRHNGVELSPNVVSQSRSGTDENSLDEQSPSTKLKNILDKYNSFEHLNVLLPVEIRLLLEKIKSQLKLRKRENFNDCISQSYLNKLNEAMELIEVKKKEKFTIKSRRHFATNKSVGSKINYGSDVSITRKKNATRELKEKSKHKSLINFNGMSYLNANGFLPEDMYSILLISSSVKTRPGPRKEHHEAAKVTNMIDDDKIDDESSISDSVIDYLSQKFSLPRTVFQVLRILWNHEDKKIIPSFTRPTCHKGDINIKIGSVNRVQATSLHLIPKSPKNLVRDNKTYIIHPTLTRRSKQSVSVLQRDAKQIKLQEKNYPINGTATDRPSTTKLKSQGCISNTGEYHEQSKSLARMNHHSGTTKRSYIPIRIQQSRTMSNV